MNPFAPAEHADILRGFARAIEVRWLIPIPHGYCFSCDQEAIVYDVLIGPSQPPRCATCFIRSMILHADDPEPDWESVSAAFGFSDPPPEDGDV